MQFVVRRVSTTIAFAQLDFSHDHRSPNHRRPLQLAKRADRRGGSGGVLCLGRTDIPCLEPARACRVLGNVGLGLARLAGNGGNPFGFAITSRATRGSGPYRLGDPRKANGFTYMGAIGNSNRCFTAISCAHRSDPCTAERGSRCNGPRDLAKPRTKARICRRRDGRHVDNILLVARRSSRILRSRSLELRALHSLARRRL